MADRLSSLLHRGAGQRRIPDDVPDRVDVRVHGLECVVYRQRARGGGWRRFRGRRTAAARPACPQQPHLAFNAVYRDRVRIQEAPFAAVDLHRVAVQRTVDQLELALHDTLLPVHEFRDRHGVGDLDADAVEPVVRESIDERGALTQGLARDGAPVHPHAAHDMLALDERDALSGACRLDCGSFSTGPAARNHHIEPGHVLSKALTSRPHRRAPPASPPSAGDGTIVTQETTRGAPFAGRLHPQGGPAVS